MISRKPSAFDNIGSRAARYAGRRERPHAKRYDDEGDEGGVCWLWTENT